MARSPCVGRANQQGTGAGLGARPGAVVARAERRTAPASRGTAPGHAGRSSCRALGRTPPRVVGVGAWGSRRALRLRELDHGPLDH
jgi:hypothetical protein